MTVAGSALARLTRAVDRLQRAVGRFLVLLMAVMVIDVTWQVASRFLLHAPSSFTEELAGFLLIWIGVLGAAYGFRTRAHLSIDLVVSRLSVGGRRAATVVAHALVAAFAVGTMVVGGGFLVRLAFQLNQISAAMGIRMGFVYLVLPLAGVLIVVFSFEAIVSAVTAEHRA